MITALTIELRYAQYVSLLLSDAFKYIESHSRVAVTFCDMVLEHYETLFDFLDAF